MEKSHLLTLKCFSPAVMILTFVIEVVGAAYVLWRYRQSFASRLAAAILVSLAVFQLAEYMICEGAFGISSVEWSRLGWVCISLLPPLGLHLGLVIAQKRAPFVTRLGYLIAGLFSVYFLTVGHGITGSVCLGNYVIFSVAPAATYLYAAYYYTWLLVGMAAAFKHAETITNKDRRQALRFLGLGYSVFIIPTTIANIIDPRTISGIPSIMCGFAVLLAIALVFGVIPRICTDTFVQRSLVTRKSV